MRRRPGEAGRSHTRGACRPSGRLWCSWGRRPTWPRDALRAGSSMWCRGGPRSFSTLEDLLAFMARVLHQRGGATWHVYPLCDLTWHADGSILYDMTTKTVDLAIWPDSPHGMGAVVASETRAVAMAGTTSALAPQERVNIDTGSAAAFVSQHSLMRHRLKAHVTGKRWS